MGLKKEYSISSKLDWLLVIDCKCRKHERIIRLYFFSEAMQMILSDDCPDSEDLNDQK